MTDELKQVAVSKAPAPIKPLVGHGVSRQVQPPSKAREPRPLPTGYISFSGLLGWLAVARQTHFLSPWVAVMVELEDQFTLEMRNYVRNEGDPEKALCDQVEQLLLDGRIQAVGITGLGNLVLIPNSAWLRVYTADRDSNLLPAFDHALANREIRYLRRGGGELHAYPILIARQLAEAFGGSLLPPMPTLIPPGLPFVAACSGVEQEPSNHAPQRLTEEDLSADAVSATAFFVRGYALAYSALMKGQTVRREEVVDAAHAELGCSKRAAIRAYIGLQYPRLRTGPAGQR